MKKINWQKKFAQETKKRIKTMDGENLDKEILRIQKSTRASSKLLCPIHDRLRMKYGWYYKWHLNPVSEKLHWAVLAVYVLMLFASAGIAVLGTSKHVKAADYTCMWINGETGNWSDTSKWIDCGPGDTEYPGQVAGKSYNVIINGGTATLDVNNLDLTAGGTSGGDITIGNSAGTLNTNGNNITVLNMTIGTGGTLTAGASTITAKGNWDHSGGTFTQGDSTVVLAGTGTLTAGGTSKPMHKLDVQGTYALAASEGLKLDHLKLTSGNLTANSSSLYLYPNSSAADCFENVGMTITSTTQSIRVVMNGTSASTPDLIPGGIYPNVNFESGGSGAERFGKLTGDITVGASSASKSLTLVSFHGSGRGTLETNGYDINTYGTIYVGSWGDPRTGHLNITGDSVVSATTDVIIRQSDDNWENRISTSADSQLKIGRHFTNNDYLDMSAGGTIEFNGTGAQTLTSGGTGAGKLFGNFIHSGAGTLQLATNDIQVNGVFTNSDGTFDAATNNLNMTFNGSWNNTGDAVFSRGSGSMTFGGAPTLTNSSSGAGDLGAISLSGASLTLGSNATMTSIIGSMELNMGSGNTLTLTGSGDPLSLMSFNKGTNSTVVYAGTTATNIGTYAYNNLQVNGATTYSLLGNLTGANAMTGDLTIGSSATLDVKPSSTAYNLTCVNMTATGILDATSSSSIITVSGNWTSSASADAFKEGTSTVNFTGSGTLYVNGWEVFYNLNTAYTGQTVTLEEHIKVSHKLTLVGDNTGHFSSSDFSSVYITAGGTDVFASNGATFSNTCQTNFWSDGVNTTVPGGGVYADTANPVYRTLLLSGYNAKTYTLSGDIAIGSDTSVYSYTASATNILDLAGYDILGSKYFTVGHNTTNTYWGKVINSSATTDSTIDASHLLIKPSSTGTGNIIDASGTRTINFSVTENYTNNGVFTAGNSTINFTKTSGVQTLVSGGTGDNQDFNILTHSGAGTLRLATNDIKINGTFTNSDGIFDAATNNLNMTFSGNWNNTGDAVFSRGSGTMTFDGTTTLTDSSSGAGNLGVLTVGGTTTLGSNTTIISASGSGTLNMGTGGYTLTVSGTGTPLDLLGFNKGTNSTVVHTGTTTATNINIYAYNNLTLSPTGATTYSLVGNLNAASSRAMTGNLTINSNATLTTTASNYNIDCVNLTVGSGGVLTANGSTITVSGDWNSSTGTFTYNQSTVNLTNTGTLTVASSYLPRFYNLILGASGKTTSIGGAQGSSFGVANVFTVGAGIFNDNNWGTVYLHGTGNVLSIDPSANLDVSLAFWSGTKNLPAHTYKNIYVSGDGATVNQTGDITVTGEFKAHGDTSAGRVLTYNTNNHSLSIGSDLQIGYSQTIPDANKTLNLGSSQVSIGGSFYQLGNLDAGTSTVNFTKSSGTQTLKSGGTGDNQDFDNLTHSGAGTLQLSSAIKVNGNLTNSNGTLDANGQDISVGGNWNISGGSFNSSVAGTPGNQTINFIGTDTAIVSGNTTFNKLTIDTASYGAKTVNFASGSTQTVNNTTTLAGAADKVLTLGRSGGSGTDKWNLAISSGFTSGQYINVSNSNVTGGTITPGSDANVVNGGNNVGWDFDTAYPTITFTASPVDPNGGGGYYKTTAPAITITADDNSRSGVASIHYRWGNSGDFSAYSTAVSAPEGTNTLYAYAVDNIGNTGVDSPSTREYKLDTALPVTDIYVSPTDPTGDNSYYKTTAPSITFEATDSESGASTIYYRWGNSGDYSAYSTALSVPEGTNTVYYYGTDVAGNSGVSSPVTREFKVDLTIPTATLASVPETPNGENNYYNTTTAITLTGNDGAGSGVASIKYRWGNSGDYTTYSSAITASEGTNTLQYYATDNAGNDGNSSTQEFKVDTVAPDFGINKPIATSPTNKMAVPISWTAEGIESGSGISSYQISIGSTSGASDILEDQSVSTNYWQQTFTTQGTYYTRVKAKDNAGNWGNYSGEGTLVINTGLPSLAIVELIDNQYVATKTYTIKGTSSDDLLNVVKVQLKFDQNEWVDASSSNNYANWTYEWKDYGEGPHTILAKATDDAGNEQSSSSYVVVVDTVAPTQASDVRAFNASNTTSNVYVVYLDFAGSTDETSGLKNYEVTKNGAKLTDIAVAKETSNPAFTGNENQPYFLVDDSVTGGRYSYKVKSIDNAGNSTETADLSIDTTSKTQLETDVITEAKGTASSVVSKDKTTATVTWKTTYPATSLVEYGESPSYGKKSEIDENFNQGHSVLLKDLKPGTTYHAKVFSKDIYNKELASEDITFTTKPAPDDKNAIKVIIETLQNLFKALTINAAETDATEVSKLQEFSGNLQLTDISFKEKGFYQYILAYPQGSKVEKSTDGKSFSGLNTSSKNYLLENGLSQNTTYYYRNNGSQPVVRKPILGDDSKLAITEAGVVKESLFSTKDKVQLTIFWKTNRGSSSQAQIGTSTDYNKKTKEDASLNTSHYATIEDLAPNTTYHFKVSSKDMKGNTAESEDFVFTTPSVEKEKTPLDIIIESLQKAFGFFGGVF